MKNGVKVILAAVTAGVLACSGLAASVTTTLTKTRTAKSGAVVLGKWHAGFSKCLAYAKANNVPLIAVWSNGDNCGHCITYEDAHNSTVFRNWMKTSGCVWFFVTPKDADGAQGGTAFNFCKGVSHGGKKNPYGIFPYVRVYWYVDGKKKVDITTSGDYIDGQQRGATGGNKSIAWYKSKLKAYTPGPVTPAVVEPYTIHFEPNGATNTMASVTNARVGVSLKLPANTLLYPDYAFAGWAKTADGAVAYANQASVKNLTTVSNGVVTLYAKWTRTVYRVTAGVKTTIAIADCKGWTKTSGAISGMKWNASTGKWTGTPTVAATFTLKYKKGSTTRTRKVVVTPGAPYSLAFAPNGATNEMASVAALYGKTLTLPANAFLRPDYAFAGWAKTAAGAVAYKNKASVRNLTAVSNKVVTLYAKWTRTVYRTYFTGVKTTIAISDCKGWTKTAGAIAGMTWASSTGKWTGTPKKAGTYTTKYKKGSTTKTRKIVVVTDAVQFADEDAVRRAVAANAPLDVNLAPSSLAGAAKAVSVKGLPDGVTYDSETGRVSGTPTRAGTFKVTVTLTSAKGQKLTRTFNLSIGVPDACVGTFHGYIGRRPAAAVGADVLKLANRGLFTLAAPSNANLSAQVVTAAGAYRLTCQGWLVNGDGTYTADLVTADGASLLLFTVDANAAASVDFAAYGTFAPAGAADEYDVWAQRSRFARDADGAYLDETVAACADQILGTWTFKAYDNGDFWSLGFAPDGDKGDVGLTVKDDGTAVLAGTIGNHAVSASSAVFVFDDDVAAGFVRADIPAPVTVNGEKQVLNVRLTLWFDRDDAHRRNLGEEIGTAELETFE